MTDNKMAPITLTEEGLSRAVEAICDRARDLAGGSTGMPMRVWQSMQDESKELLAIAADMENQARKES